MSSWQAMTRLPLRDLKNPKFRYSTGTVLHAFIAGLEMPRGLAAVNVPPESFGRIAEGAMDTPWVPRNPRPIDGPAQIREILVLAA
jgi:maleylacetate reductase